jgi:WD40 repeat protein
MSVAVDQQDPKVLYSAGWDQTIRSWDASFAISITTQNCNKPVNHMDYSAPAGLLATAHSDSAVRVWDLRAQGNRACVVHTLVSNQHHLISFAHTIT